jgi:hypothetical protein
MGRLEREKWRERGFGHALRRDAERYMQQLF